MKEKGPSRHFVSCSCVLLRISLSLPVTGCERTLSQSHYVPGQIKSFGDAHHGALAGPENGRYGNINEFATNEVCRLTITHTNCIFFHAKFSRDSLQNIKGLWSETGLLVISF